jgi:hypothetical protein
MIIYVIYIQEYILYLYRNTIYAYVHTYVNAYM